MNKFKIIRFVCLVVIGASLIYLGLNFQDYSKEVKEKYFTPLVTHPAPLVQPKMPVK